MHFQLSCTENTTKFHYLIRRLPLELIRKILWWQYQRYLDDAKSTINARNLLKFIYKFIYFLSTNIRLRSSLLLLAESQLIVKYFIKNREVCETCYQLFAHRDRIEEENTCILHVVEVESPHLIACQTLPIASFSGRNPPRMGMLSTGVREVPSVNLKRTQNAIS